MNGKQKGLVSACWLNPYFGLGRCDFKHANSTVWYAKCCVIYNFVWHLPPCQWSTIWLNIWTGCVNKHRSVFYVMTTMFFEVTCLTCSPAIQNCIVVTKTQINPSHHLDNQIWPHVRPIKRKTPTKNVCTWFPFEDWIGCVYHQTRCLLLGGL